MDYYWDSPDVPSTSPQPLVRVPAPPLSNWEYARLQEDLPSHGSASAVIVRGTTNTAINVEVFDFILPSTTVLSGGSIVKISWYAPLGEWVLDDWTIART